MADIEIAMRKYLASSEKIQTLRLNLFVKYTECKVNTCLTSQDAHDDQQSLNNCYRECAKPLVYQQRFALDIYK